MHPLSAKAGQLMRVSIGCKEECTFFFNLQVEFGNYASCRYQKNYLRHHNVESPCNMSSSNVRERKIGRYYTSTLINVRKMIILITVSQ